MKKSKKLLSLFLAVMMISSMFASFNVFADNANGTNETVDHDNSVVIADFGTKTAIDSYGLYNPLYPNSYLASVDYVYGDADTSLKIAQSASQSKCMSVSVTDWSSYSNLKVRYYVPEIAESETVKVNILLMSTVSDSVTGVTYSYLNLDTQKTGWNDAILSLSGKSNISNIKGIMFNVGSWGDTTRATDSVIYIDKITLVNQFEYISADLEDGVIVDNGYIRGPISTWANGHNMLVGRTLENSRDGSYINTFGLDATYNIQYHLFYSSYKSNGSTISAPLDLSGYDTMNVWLYSNGEYSDKLTFEINNAGTTTSYATDIALNGWDGWKLFTWDVGELGNDIRKIMVRPYKNSSASNSTDIESFAIDKLWFTSSSTSLVKDGYSLNEFSTPSSTTTKNASQTMAAKNTQNNNLYNMNARIENTASVERFIYTTGSTKADDLAASVLSQYDYINVLMYNPEVKCYKDTTNPYEVNFVCKYTNDSGSTANHGANEFTLDWTGWTIKSFAIPTVIKTNGLDSIMFNIGGWSATKWDNGASYFDIDAVWLSGEKPAATVFSKTADTYANGEEGFVLDANKYTFSGKILATDAAASVKVYDKNLNKLTLNTDYTISVSGNELTVQPTTAGTYSVVIDGLTPAYPAHKAERFVNTFTIKNTDTPEIDSANATYNVRYILPAGYEASTLVAAEYNNSELVQVATSDWENNSATVTFDIAPTAGNTVKFIFVNTMDSIYPFYTFEEKTVANN